MHQEMIDVLIWRSLRSMLPLGGPLTVAQGFACARQTHKTAPHHCFVFVIDKIACTDLVRQIPIQSQPRSTSPKPP